ncbi:MAG: GTPase HflX [Provencibacterium sp.]|nr:GTPase HflX [Provencibacterium sp.]
MYENKACTERAILAAVDTGEYDVDLSLDELAALAESAGAAVLARISQKRPQFDPATCMGEGRIEELAEAVKAYECNLVIFDHELSASQLRNIEQAVGAAVIDRTMLILDIFAQRAVTDEGKLQVELAQQRYLLPRLQGIGTQLSRLGGGIGTRGPGETKLEADRRHIRRRIGALEQRLKELCARRERLRARRKKDSVTTVAVVGYTNVGKSTLLNALTGADVLAENRLFATLDLTSRALELPDGRSVLLVDTVGLIRRLPHHLVEAFHSTLEEAAAADLILIVCDISSPDADEQLEVTQKVLSELGADGIPVVIACNKCDVAGPLPFPLQKNTMLISAKTGFGFDRLLSAIAEGLAPTQQRMRLLIPYAKSALRQEITEAGKVLYEEYTENGILLDALVDYKILYKFEGMTLPQQENEKRKEE